MCLSCAWMSRNGALEAWEGGVGAFPVADLLDNKSTFFFKNLRLYFILIFSLVLVGDQRN